MDRQDALDIQDLIRQALREDVTPTVVGRRQLGALSGALGVLPPDVPGGAVIQEIVPVLIRENGLLREMFATTVDQLVQSCCEAAAWRRAAHRWALLSVVLGLLFIGFMVWLGMIHWRY